MSVNCVIHFVDSDIPHVCLESVHKSAFCLAYILFTTLYTSNEVKYVSTFTANFFPRYVGCGGRMAFDVTAAVQ